VGHTPKMRGCNTVNPSTRLVSRVAVGHFGGGKQGHFGGGEPGESRGTLAGESRDTLAEKKKQRPDILDVKFLCTIFTSI